MVQLGPILQNMISAFLAIARLNQTLHRPFLCLGLSHTVGQSEPNPPLATSVKSRGNRRGKSLSLFLRSRVSQVASD